MRLAIIVTDFPKVTETFILRDLVAFQQRGHEVRVYHLTPFRHNEVVHDFARPALAWGKDSPFWFGRQPLGALARALWQRPRQLMDIIGNLLWGFRREPEWLLKSLFLIPKCLSFAEDVKRWGADHIHAEFATHPATCAWIMGRLTGIPYSVSCHAHDIFLTQAMLDKKLGEAAFVRTISQFNKTFLQQRLPKLRHIPFEVIHVSVPCEEISPLPRPPNPPFRVLYIGSLETRKGVNYLLEALAAVDTELGPWECEIIGDGPHRSELEQTSQSLGLTSRVRFVGSKDFSEVSAALDRSHVLVVPSIIGPGGRTEGLPTVIIEALAHERPVIASRLTGIPELVVDGETGMLVEPGDTQGIGKALLTLRQNPADGQRMAQNGRRRVEAEFDLDHNVDAQLQCFEHYHIHQPAKESVR